MLFVAIIPYLVATSGCLQSEEKEEQAPVLTFQALDSLLAPATRDTVLRISYAAPRGWDKIPEKVTREVFKKLKMVGTTERDVQFQAGYWERNSGSILTVNKLNLDDSTIVQDYFKNAKQYYGERDSSQVRAGVFSTSSFTVHQLLITEPYQILLKLIFESKEENSLPFEFNFMIPVTIYGKQLKSIESCIGSIQSTTLTH